MADRVPLPLLLYNMPEMTKHVLEADTIRRLADCPNIVGVKDSGGDLGSFAEVVRVARAKFMPAHATVGAAVDELAAHMRTRLKEVSRGRQAAGEGGGASGPYSVPG